MTIHFKNGSKKEVSKKVIESILEGFSSKSKFTAVRDDVGNMLVVNLDEIVYID